MSKLRKVPPCKQLVATIFNENSNLISLEENELINTVRDIEHGDSAIHAALFLINGFEDLKFNLEKGDLNPKGIYRGYMNGSKSIELLKFLNSKFKLGKQVKYQLDFIIKIYGDFFKLSKPELRKLKKEAEYYVSIEESNNIENSLELLYGVTEELTLYKRFNALKEICFSIWYRIVPLISQYKKDIGSRDFNKTIFGSKNALDLDSLSKSPEIIDCYNLKKILESLPDYILSKFFKGFSLEINEDLTVTVFCKNRGIDNRHNDQKDYVHPYGGNPNFSDKHNEWFKKNAQELKYPIGRASLEKELKQILSHYSDEILFPEKKTDFFMLSMKSDEITELYYNSSMLRGREG